MTLWIATLSGAGVLLGLLILVGVLATWQRRAAREARDWGRQVLQAQEDERRRIARELHDGVVSQLVRARALAIAAHEDSDLADRLHHMATDLRAVSHGLHPPSIGTATIAQMLGDLQEADATRDGPAISLDTQSEAELPAAEKLALYRVAQEAVANARKHAGARTVALTLTEDREGLRLVIDDDGRGLPDPDPRGHAFGLRSMHERMAMIGGTLTITARPGGGTRVIARLPRR